MKAVQHLASILFIISLPVLLVTTNVRVAAGEVELYERGFREHDASERTGVPLPELDRAAREIIHYFEDDSQTLRIVVDRGGQEVSLFNERETEHMRDVKDLIRGVFRVHEITLAIVLSYIAARFLWTGDSLRTLALQSLLGLAAGVLVVGAIGAFALTGFDEAWTRFHEIAFTNDLWQLDPDSDRLIQMFPQPFWEEMTYFVGLATIAEATLILIVATGYLAFTRRSGQRSAPEEAAAAQEAPAANTRL